MKPLLYTILCCSLFIVSCLSNENTSADSSSAEDTIIQENKVDSILEFPVIEPINQSQLNDELAVVLDKLVKIAEQKSVNQLMQYISKNVLNDFKGSTGHEDFKTAWSLSGSTAKQSEVWQLLRKLIKIGGTFENDSTYVTPFIFSTFPDGYEIKDFAAITGTHVRMRDEPNLQGEVVTELDYEVVKLGDPSKSVVQQLGSEKYPWVEIIRQNKEKGFVYGQYLYSPADYRIQLSNTSGKWMITHLVSGN